MAISAAVGVGKKIIGKAISAAKKKKKNLETKGRRVKGLQTEKVVEKELDTAMKQYKKTGSTKGFENVRQGKVSPEGLEKAKAIQDTPDIVTGAAATAQQATKKAIRGAKKVTAKAQEKTSKLMEGTTLGKAIGKDPTRAAELGGAALLTGALAQSVIKSTMKPESLYDISRLPDGRFSTTFRDKNKNVIFSRKELTATQIDDVRTKLAILDSILESSEPYKRKNEFLNTAQYLGKTYGISNISGKNISLLMPTEVYEGKTTTYRKKKN